MWVCYYYRLQSVVCHGGVAIHAVVECCSVEGHFLAVDGVHGHGHTVHIHSSHRLAEHVDRHTSPNETAAAEVLGELKNTTVAHGIWVKGLNSKLKLSS